MDFSKHPIILKLNATYEVIHVRMGMAFPGLLNYGLYLIQHDHGDPDPEKLLYQYVKDFDQEPLLYLINEMHDVLLMGVPTEKDFNVFLCDVLLIPRNIAKRAGVTPRQLLTDQHQQLLALKPAKWVVTEPDSP